MRPCDYAQFEEVISLKICVTSNGKTLQSPLNPRFGRCPYFLVVDTDKESVEALENTGAGAQLVSDAGCRVVITGNVGPNAFFALNTAGIKVFVGASGKNCEQALKDYNEGKLAEASAASARGLGWGRFGRGRGRGRKSAN